jgi:hypothetical protein
MISLRYLENFMGSELELYEARLSYLRLDSDPAECHFSYAHIHKTKGSPARDTGQGWTQEAILLLERAKMTAGHPHLPNTIVDGYIETGGERYELMPIPFERDGEARLDLHFADGTSLELSGLNPVLKLVGDKVFLRDYF